MLEKILDPQSQNRFVMENIPAIRKKFSTAQLQAMAIDPFLVSNYTRYLASASGRCYQAYSLNQILSSNSSVFPFLCTLIMLKTIGVCILFMVW